MMSDPSSGSVMFSRRIVVVIHQIVIPDDLPQVPRPQRRQFLGEQIWVFRVHGERVQDRLVPPMFGLATFCRAAVVWW